MLDIVASGGLVAASPGARDIRCHGTLEFWPSALLLYHEFNARGSRDWIKTITPSSPPPPSAPSAAAVEISIRGAYTTLLLLCGGGGCTVTLGAAREALGGTMIVLFSLLLPWSRFDRRSSVLSGRLFSALSVVDIFDFLFCFGFSLTCMFVLNIRRAGQLGGRPLSFERTPQCPLTFPSPPPRPFLPLPLTSLPKTRAKGPQFDCCICDFGV